MNIQKRIARVRHLFLTDSLFRNAALLMFSTAIMSVLGFGFWLFVAHLYTPSQIGIASALISVTTLISNLSLLGFNAGLIRFLPRVRDQSRVINAAMIIVAGVTMAGAAIYVLTAHWFGANVSFMASPLSKILFIILMTSVSLNSLTDAVFIANRRAEFHTAAYAVLGLVKLLCPLFLIPLGSLGIFSAYMISMILSLVFSIFLMHRYCGYRLFARPNWSVIKKIRRFTTNNYVGVVLSGLPSQVLPWMIIRRLGSDDAAFFSMAWTMANLLWVIPAASTQSLLAENSHSPEKRATNTKHAVRLLLQIMAPAVVFAVLVAPYLLRIFGPQYSHGSTVIFQILSLTTFSLAYTSLRNVVLNIEHRSGGIVGVQAALLVVTLASAPFLMHCGLTGVGLAILFGNLASNAVHVWLAWRQPAVRTVERVPFAASRRNIGKLLEAYDIEAFDYRELGNGSSNYTFLIRHHGRLLHVLRIYKLDTRSTESIEREVEFVDYLAAHGIPVPRTIRNRHGQAIAHAEVDGVERQYMLMTFEPGRHPRVYTPQLIKTMATDQARIHLLGQEFSPEDSAPIATSKIHRQKRSLGRLLFLNRTPGGYSHFDYDASNVLVDGDRLASIIDFEGMHSGPLVSCLYHTLASVYDSRQDVEEVRRYLAYYQQLRPLSRDERLVLRLGLFTHTASIRLALVAMRAK